MRQSAANTSGKLSSGPAFTIRPYTPADREAVLALREKHDKTLWFADPDHPINFESYLMEVDGQLVAIITGRMTIEGFVMVDNGYGEPQTRLEILETMIDAAAKRAEELRIPEVHMGVMPENRAWLRRLLKMKGVFRDFRNHVILAAGGRLEEN